MQDVDGENTSLTPVDLETVEIIGRLLGLDATNVRDLTLQRQINVRGNITQIPLKVQEVKHRSITNPLEF